MNSIKANRDPNVLIKEIDKFCIHVRLTKASVNPADPIASRSENSRIQIFSVKEFEAMQKRHSRPDEWVAVGGFTAAYVVHDGRLEPEEKVIEDVVSDAIDEVVSTEVKAAIKKEVRKRNVRKSLNTVK